MASVRKRKWTHKGEEKTAWVLTYTDAGGKPRLKTFKTKKEADRVRLEVENDLNGGTHVADAETLKFKDAAERWLRDCERRNKEVGSPVLSTIYGSRCTIRNHLVPAFGHRLMTALTGEEIQAWMDRKTATATRSTLASYRTALNCIIQHCIRTKVLKRNVMKDFEVRIRAPRKRIAVPSKADIAALLSTLESRHHGENRLPFLQRRAFVYLALFGGLRMGEICALRWDGLDLDGNALTVAQSYSKPNGLKAPKTESGLRVATSVAASRQALIDLKAFLGDAASEFVFRSRDGHMMYTALVHRNLWRPLMKRAGLAFETGQPKFHFHALRHANVSMLIEHGVNALHISKHVGHSQVTTTLNIYGHLFPEDDRVSRSLEGIAAGLLPTRDRQELLTI